MFRNGDMQESNSSTSIKKSNRCRSFHFRYLELCRSRNLTPLADIRAKNNSTAYLDFHGDKLGVNDWLLIVDALHHDQVLQTLAIRLRRPISTIYDQLDTEKKAKLFRQKAVICTKFVISGLVEAVSNCIEFNKNLRILHLEGLPLSENYVEFLAKALSSNENLKEISFQRTFIHDKGCEAICNTVKYLANVEILNLSECELSHKGALHVADMIKVQKITRYTEGWQKSLRYRDVDPDTIPGLRSIALARNTQIGDEGLKAIIEILKEDVWIKIIDMENCGLTDRSANIILDCLEINHYIIDFNVRNNPGISKFLQRSIREQLGKDDDDNCKPNDDTGKSGINGSNNVNKRTKMTLGQLREQLKTLEEQLAFERVLRKKAELLNEKLNEQILAYERQLEKGTKVGVPEGYVVVKNESLQSIIKERNEFHELAAAAAYNSNSNNSSPRTVYTPLPKIQNVEQKIQQENIVMVTADSSTESPREPRKVLKVRKVKSEMKYIDPMAKDKKKESKSDHEFANELDFNLTTVQFETNIGDSAKHNNTQATITHQGSQVITSCVDGVSEKIEIDDLSISTARSCSSDCASDESDTLRNSPRDYYPMKVFIRRNKQQSQQQSQSTQQMLDQEDAGVANVNKGKNNGYKSPRSLFFGGCDN